MRYYLFIYLTTLCSAVFMPGFLTAGTALHEADTKAASVRAEKTETMVPVAESHQQSDITPFVADAGFLETSRNLIAAVYESDDGLSSAQETTNALLDLADLYFNYALVAEGQSIITGIEDKTLSEKQTARLSELSVALNIIDPWGMELSEANISLLEGPSEWPRHALFRSLYYIKKNMPEKAQPFLTEALEDIQGLRVYVKELMLPDILNAAIDLGDWEVARTSAEIFMESPTLNKGSAYHYLLGRTAENGRDYLVAFDHFVKATEKLDSWSQLAGLSLVKMGLATKTLTPRDARTLLEQIRFAWRGDALSYDAQILLTKVELLLNDIPAALEVLGEIIYMNEDEDRFSKAIEQANGLLTSYYEDGLSGKISLAKFLSGHKRIAQDFRFQEGFDRYSEMFADRFLAIGASNEAAYEYETIYNYLSVAQDLGLFEVTSKRLDQVRLKQVAAYLRGGQYDHAEPILAYGPESADPDMQDQFTFLKAEIFTQTGNLQSFIDAKVQEPSIDYLRIKAEVYFSMEDWNEAVKVYCIIWKRMGNDILFTDTLNLFISAYRNNDSQLTIRLAKAFPDLTKVPRWQQIADWLVEERNAVNILQKDTITTGISDASRVLDVMEVINTSSE